MSGQRCRACGCTEDNCYGCVATTGAPCWWVKSDLCSACAPRIDAIAVLIKQVTNLAIDACRGFAAILVLVDRDGVGHIGSSTLPVFDVPHQELRAAVIRGLGGRDVPGTLQIATIPPAPLLDRVACIHCRQDVAAPTDVDAIRAHTMTCPSSPVVKELAAARARIAKLEIDLGDLAYERNQLQLEHEKAGAARG